MTRTQNAATRLRSLGEVTTSRAGKTPSRVDPSYWGGSIPWATAKDLKRHRLRDTQERITQDAVRDGTPLAQPGDVLVLVRGMTLLKDVPVGLVEAPLSFNQDVRCFRPGPEVSGEYLSYLLSAMRQELLGLVTQAGHGTGRIESGQLADVLLRLPSLAAQHRAVTQLGAVERVIDVLSSLIRSKRMLKQNVMSGLLTGHRRFQAFGNASSDPNLPPTGWTISTLGQCSEISVSGVDKHTRADEIPVRLCNYMDVWTQPYLTSEREFANGSATAAEVERFRLRAGDVLVTKDSETREEIAQPSVVLDVSKDVILGYHLALIRPTNGAVDGRFLSSQLRLPRFRRHFVRGAQGATRFGLTIETLKSATVWLPSLEEQQRIADVDFQLHSELMLLERQIRLFETQKRALMHRLLSGDIPDLDPAA